VTVAGVLDLDQIQALLDRVQEETGIVREQYSLSVGPDIAVDGTLAGQPFREQFAPRIAFRLDSFQLQLVVPPGTPKDQLRPSQHGVAKVPRVEPNGLSLLAPTIPIALARTIALAGLIVSALGAVITTFLLLRARGAAQRGGEPARLEQRRVDPVRELCRLVERPLHVLAHLVEQRPRRGWIGIRQPACQLEVDRERDEVLLRTVVKLALESATVGIGSRHDARSRRAQLLDLEAQPVERLLRPLDGRNLQVTDLLLEDSRKVPRRTAVVKRPSPRTEGVSAWRRSRLPPR
jgi:hypothetical protein